MNTVKRKALQIRNMLIEAYGFPIWRNPLPPLDELVSTILSQNTNDINRDKAFDRLVNELPAWELVRDAPKEDVINLIRPAGLANQKGPRIQQVLKDISTEQGDLTLDFLRNKPSDQVRSWLLRFKGVGPKTAAIVMLFSLDLYAFPVDTHVNRVTKRLGLVPEKMTVSDAHRYLENVFVESHYYDVHLNMIKLGREICQSRKPKCLDCPIRTHCKYWSSNSRN